MATNRAFCASISGRKELLTMDTVTQSQSLKTRIHAYSCDTSKPEDSHAYQQLTNKLQGDTAALAGRQSKFGNR
jgi:hypothetical protein